MAEALKDRVLEIVAITKECPEQLQALCFELLLRDYLESRQIASPPVADPPATLHPVGPARVEEEEDKEEPEAKGQQDVRAGDLHMRARKFLDRHSISIDQLNELFYKEDGTITPLYEDLKTTRMAEAQIRVTLLHALLAGIRTGEFIADGEAVRAECQLRKSYDRPNFATNFKNNANLFEGFESYAKGTELRLSEDGRKELAELIRELAK